MAAESHGRLKECEDGDGMCISLFSSIQLEAVPASTFNKTIMQINCQIECNVFDSVSELIQEYNLMTFCFWKVHNRNAAVKYNNKALQANSDNIIALGNKAWIHEKCIELSEAEYIKKILCYIKAAKAPGQIDPFLISQTEIAYAYSQFGPAFAQTAIDIYTRVLQHVKLTGYHADVCRWKYEKALTAGRLAVYDLNESNKENSVILQLFKDSITLFNEVIRETQLTRLKARSWAMLGDITQTVNSQFSEESIQKQHVFPDDLNIRPDRMLLKALQTYMPDRSVLETCAQVYRRLHMRDEAIQYFQKANEIRETSFSHHHLALTLFAKKKEIERKRRYLHSIEISSTFAQRVGSFLNNVGSYIFGLISCIFGNNLKLQFDAETLDIYNHFNTSIKLDPGNHAALKDFGKFYYFLGYNEKAKEHYMRIIHSERATSPMLATCYEKIGFCHVQLSKTSSSGEEGNNNNLAAIHCFFKAAEMCADNKIRMVRARKSLPALHSLLHTRYNDPRMKNKLAALYDKFGYNKNAQSIYLDILKGNNVNIDVYKSLINTYIHDDNFDKALCYLNMLKRSQKSASIESGVYVKAYIEGALQSYSRNDISEAKLRFMAALFHYRKEHSETIKSDAFMIISGDVAERHCVEEIKKLLSQVCGLKITSTDDIAPGQDLIIEFGLLANATRQQIIVLNKSSNDPYFGEMIRRSSQECLPPILVIKLDKTDTPDSLRIHHAIEYHMANNEENDDGKRTEEKYPHKSRNVSREVDFLKKVFYVMCGLNEF